MKHTYTTINHVLMIVYFNSIRTHSHYINSEWHMCNFTPKYAHSFTSPQAKFSLSPKWYCSSRKGPYTQYTPPLRHLPCTALESVVLVEYRAFSSSQHGTSATFLHSSLLQAISTVVIWAILVQQVSVSFITPLCCQPLYVSCDAQSFTQTPAQPGFVGSAQTIVHAATLR